MSRLKHLYYVLTARCNQKCVICPRSQSERVRDADHDEVLKKLEALITENEITDVTLSGGEPTVYQDLGRVIALLDRLAVKVSVLTNAMRLEKEELAKDIFAGLVHKENFRVITAIHGLTPEVHDGVTGIKSSLERCCQALRNVSNQGIPVMVKCVIGAHNGAMLKDYPRWVRDHISENAEILFCGMDYAGMSDELTDRFKVDFRDVKSSLEQALDAAFEKTHKGRIMISEVPLCAVDPYYWNLFLSPPPKQSVYDDSHWEASMVSVPDIYPMAEGCRDCIVKAYCSGIWRTQYEVFGESAVKPFLK